MNTNHTFAGEINCNSGDYIKLEDGVAYTEAKDTDNKLDWNLINLKGFENIVRVREFGSKKYSDPENWKLVHPKEYLNAIKRHIVEMDDKGIYAIDEESGLPHIAHVACNAYFIDWFFTNRSKL